MKALLNLMIVACVLTGCVGTKGPPLESQVYALEYAAPQPSAPEEVLDCSLRVDAFDAHPFFGTDRMIYREKAFQTAAYRYHRWQAPPARLLAWHLERDLKSAGFCRAVIGSDSLLPATHNLEGTVDEFFENDTADGWEAVLTLRLTLAGEPGTSGGRRILLQRSYTERQPSRHRTPQSMAEAMSRALAEVSRQALDDIRAALDRQSGRRSNE